MTAPKNKDFSRYRNSSELLERAAYWAAHASWRDPDDFEQGQEDANALLEIKNRFSVRIQCLSCSYDEYANTPEQLVPFVTGHQNGRHTCEGPVFVSSYDSADDTFEIAKRAYELALAIRTAPR